MFDRSGGHQIPGICNGNKSSDNVLSMVEFSRMDGMAILDEHGETSVAHNCRVGKNLADDSSVVSLVTGFFAQLAKPSRYRIGIGGVHHPARDLKLHRIGAVPILLDHHELTVRG